MVISCLLGIEPLSSPLQSLCFAEPVEAIWVGVSLKLSGNVVSAMGKGKLYILYNLHWIDMVELGQD